MLFNRRQAVIKPLRHEDFCPGSASSIHGQPYALPGIQARHVVGNVLREVATPADLRERVVQIEFT